MQCLAPQTCPADWYSGSRLRSTISTLPRFPALHTSHADYKRLADGRPSTMSRIYQLPYPVFTPYIGCIPSLLFPLAEIFRELNDHSPVQSPSATHVCSPVVSIYRTPRQCYMLLIRLIWLFHIINETQICAVGSPSPARKVTAKPVSIVLRRRQQHGNRTGTEQDTRCG